MTIELRDVTMENYFDVLNLDVKEYQKQFRTCGEKEMSR